MRAGSEQFILKDFEFYDSMVTPAIGVTAVFVYEILRRHIWRALDRGSARSRDAFRAGKLCASISRKKIALMTGLSVRHIQKDMNRLREVGWVRSKSGRWTGETLLYELGYRQGGFECFYADGSLRELHLALTDLAESREVSVSRVSCEERLDFARLWFEDGVVHDLHTGSAQDALPPAEGSAQDALIIENPPGGEIEKAEESPGRSAPDGQTGPEPKHWAGPDNERRKRSRPSKKNVVGRSEPTNDQEQEEGLAEFALDTEAGPGQNVGDRLARAAATAAGAKKKASDQAAENAKRRILKQRTEKVAKVTTRESKAENFKGRHPPEVVKAARKAWDVYKQEIEGLDDGFMVPKWVAKGNAKARGQVCELVDMYGGESTEQAIRYVVGNWDKIGARFFKRDPGGVPNLGRLYVLHEQLFREATVWGRHREVLDEWSEWFEAHRYDEASPPAGLQERYDQARASLESLGLGG